MGEKPGTEAAVGETDFSANALPVPQPDPSPRPFAICHPPDAHKSSPMSAQVASQTALVQRASQRAFFTRSKPSQARTLRMAARALTQDELKQQVRHRPGRLESGSAARAAPTCTTPHMWDNMPHSPISVSFRDSSNRQESLPCCRRPGRRLNT